MKTSDLKYIIINELYKNKLFDNYFEIINIERYDYGRIVSVNVRFTDEMMEEYYDENGDYDWERSSKDYENILDYTIKVIKKIVPDKIKFLKYEDYEIDGPDLYIEFEDTKVAKEIGYY